MIDWERIASASFFTLVGVGVLSGLLVVVARVVRGGRSAVSEQPLSRWPAILAAIGALVFAFVSVQGELSVIGAAPVIAFIGAAAKRATVAETAHSDARWLALLAGLAWAAASVTQFAAAEWSKTVNGPIRADLLVTGPLLALTTYLAVSARSQRPPVSRTAKGGRDGPEGGRLRSRGR